MKAVSAGYSRHEALFNAEKLLYLQTTQTGKGASAVAGIEVTGANYANVIEILKERFGRSDVLIQEHLTQLLDLPSIRSENAVNSLRRLYDHLQRNMSALTVLGMKSESYGAILCSALLRTLPSELVLEYHRRRSAVREDDGLRIESLLDFLKTEVESR